MPSGYVALWTLHSTCHHHVFFYPKKTSLNMLLGALMWRLNTTFQLVECHFKKLTNMFPQQQHKLTISKEEECTVQLRTCHHHQWIYDIFFSSSASIPFTSGMFVYNITFIDCGTLCQLEKGTEILEMSWQMWKIVTGK